MRFPFARADEVYLENLEADVTGHGPKEPALGS